jgi:hypothetical protein
MFLPKAIKPARLFVNRILALLWEMGEATTIAIDEASKKDLQRFIACARAINGIVSIYKCLQVAYIFTWMPHFMVEGGPLTCVYIHPLSTTDPVGKLRIGRPSMLL